MTLAKARESGVSAADLDRLQNRLVAGAAREHLLDVAVLEIDSPVGRLLLAGTERGLVRVAFECERFDHVLTDLAARVSPRILRAPTRLEQVAAQLEEYFGRRRTVFDVSLDHALSTGFRDRVQRHLTRIPYGRTASYGQLAEAIGTPGAARAVGTACASNPLPIIQPCHRVVRAGGSLGSYLGGPAAKAALLALESAS